MHTPLSQQESDVKQPSGFLVILHWLASPILLTEEEQEDAGIYLER